MPVLHGPTVVLCCVLCAVWSQVAAQTSCWVVTLTTWRASSSGRCSCQQLCHRCAAAAAAPRTCLPCALGGDTSTAAATWPAAWQVVSLLYQYTPACRVAHFITTPSQEGFTVTTCCRRLIWMTTHMPGAGPAARACAALQQTPASSLAR
jgi:hypothetical protein